MCALTHMHSGCTEAQLAQNPYIIVAKMQLYSLLHPNTAVDYGYYVLVQAHQFNMITGLLCGISVDNWYRKCHAKSPK